MLPIGEIRDRMIHWTSAPFSTYAGANGALVEHRSILRQQSARVVRTLTQLSQPSLSREGAVGGWRAPDQARQGRSEAE
jgi:hypothetical protein